MMDPVRQSIRRERLLCLISTLAGATVTKKGLPDADYEKSAARSIVRFAEVVEEQSRHLFEGPEKEESEKEER
jgi:hypothetical protein